MSETSLINQTTNEETNIVEPAETGGRIPECDPSGASAGPIHRPTYQGAATSDFITDYADYANVFELPRKVHEWVACQLIASAINGKVSIPWGAVECPLDLWVLLLSESGQGRNTATEVALEVAEQAGIQGLIHSASWGSKQAFYQQLAESPRGLYVWPELSVVLRTLRDSKFAGVKEWITDRYDNLRIPPAIKYRETGKKQDTPPIKFAGVPRINVLATSSLDWFIGGLEQEDATGGFIPRWLLIRLENSGRILPKPLPLNRALVPGLAASLSGFNRLSGRADLSAIEAIYEEWYRSARGRFQSQANPSLAMPFFNRLRLQVLKLAVVFEVSQSGSLIVSPQAMNRAIEAAHDIERTIFEMLPAGMNREGYEVEKMAERIYRAGPAGISQSKLTLAFKHWKHQEREARLRTLTDSRTVHCFDRQTRGRTGKMYVHQKHFRAYRRRRRKDHLCP